VCMCVLVWNGAEKRDCGSYIEYYSDIQGSETILYYRIILSLQTESVLFVLYATNGLGVLCGSCFLACLAVQYWSTHFNVLHGPTFAVPFAWSAQVYTIHLLQVLVYDIYLSNLI
jgi:hypothetical protein